jgi:hypothetical protein
MPKHWINRNGRPRRIDLALERLAEQAARVKVVLEMRSLAAVMTADPEAQALTEHCARA